MRVLVLGWEYPPIVAGGLGAACHGLTTALAKRGHEVLLVVPKGGGTAARGGAASRSAAGDAPGIRRIEIDLGPEPSPGAKGGSGHGGEVLLSPYLRIASPGISAAAGQGRQVTERRAAHHHLYGAELHLALERYAARVHGALRGQTFDVIHAHDWMTIPAATRLRMNSGNTPLCLHVHSTAFDRSGFDRAVFDRVGLGRGRRDPIRRVESAGIRTADRVVAVSDYGRRMILEQYGPDPDRVDVVHNAAPPRSSGPPREAPLGGRTGPPTALFLARLTRQKGASFFLRAAALVCARRPESRFVIAGDGEDRLRLIEESASLGIARNVHFAESLNDASRDRAYRAASVFVLSSLSEPFGLTPLEALRQGTPVILSDDAGVREVLPSAPHAPPWDRRGLAAHIERVFDDPAYAKRLVQSGIEDLEGCDWDASAAALEAALMETIRCNGRMEARGARSKFTRGISPRRGPRQGG